MLEKPTPRPEPPKRENFASPEEAALIEKLEGTPGESFLRRENLSHPLIVQARTILKNAEPNDYTIVRTREKCLDIRVSKTGLDRALRIMAGLICALEEAGFVVGVEPDRQEKPDPTVAKIYGQTIRFGLTEKVDRVDLVAPPKGGLLERGRGKPGVSRVLNNAALISSNRRLKRAK